MKNKEQAPMSETAVTAGEIQDGRYTENTMPLTAVVASGYQLRWILIHQWFDKDAE